MEAHEVRTEESAAADSSAHESDYHLSIAEKVVEKTAGQILRDMPGVGGRSSGFLGIGSESSLSTRPQVSVTLTGRACTLEVEVGLQYPAPITSMTESIRRHLSEEVERLTGVDVRVVDISVAWLRTETELKPVRRLQ